jgi:hypothetical protein
VDDDVAGAHVTAVDAQPGSDYELGARTCRQRPFEIVRELRGTACPPDSVPVAAAVGAVEEWKAQLIGRPPVLLANGRDLPARLASRLGRGHSGIWGSRSRRSDRVEMLLSALRTRH